jgi:hypothetical protein
MCNQAGKGDPVAIRRQLPVDSPAADLRARAEILAISGNPTGGGAPRAHCPPDSAMSAALFGHPGAARMAMAHPRGGGAGC